jgi:hypothetical protein
MSRQVWRTRLVFWSGAVLVGLAATALAIGSDHAGQLFTLSPAGNGFHERCT